MWTDALVYDRVYRPAVPEDQVLSVMAEGMGKHFDPKILECFFYLLPEIRRIREEARNRKSGIGIALPSVLNPDKDVDRR